MNSIVKEVYETIKLLILESEWGKSVTNTELFGFLFDEAYELLEGCSKQDKENILEEASDVLMILLYIVIKNTDNRNDNQIEELLYRLNTKLRTRYSVFFENDQNDDEEHHWEQTKRLEKEVLHYLFCPNVDCQNFAKVDKGNMAMIGDQVKCSTCGYNSKLSKSNIVLYNSRYRRKLLSNLDNYYLGYLNNSLFFADVFFNNHNEDYIQIVRYWATNITGSMALVDYISSKHNASQETFDEFLMYPLRNYLKTLIIDQIKPTRRTIIINDLLIKLINSNYRHIKNKFCGNESIEYQDIWDEYIRYLLKSMACPITIEPFIGECHPLPMNVSQGNNVLNAYVINVRLIQDRQTNVYLDLSSIDDRNASRKAPLLQADIEQCNMNTQVGQVLMSVIIKFNLNNKHSLKCELLNCNRNLDQQELVSFLKDLLPMVYSIEFK